MITTTTMSPPDNLYSTQPKLKQVQLCNWKPLIYIDMDDTMCNYSAEHITAKLETGLEYPQSQLGFFERLQPVPGALRAIRGLEAFATVMFATRPSIKNVHCYTEKAKWIKKYLGEDALDRLIIISDKSLLIGDYLIDDCPWPHFNGTQIKTLS